MNGRSGSRMVLRPVNGEKEERPVMAKSKKGSKKPSVKVEDLQPEADPKGGSLNYSKIVVEYKEQTLNTLTAANKLNSGIKLNSTLGSIGDLSLKHR